MFLYFVLIMHLSSRIFFNESLQFLRQPVKRQHTVYQQLPLLLLAVHKVVYLEDPATISLYLFPENQNALPSIF